MHNLNMNANGDAFVSFNVMDIAFSPNGKYILLTTDKSRSIMLLRDTAVQVRNFYGATNDEYSQARGGWSRNGDVVYSTSQDNVIVAWDVPSQREVGRLKAHSKLIRDFDAHPTRECLVSCSYDKTIRIWEAPPS